MNIAVVAITSHGIELAGRIVAALPEAQLFAPQKFHDAALAAAPGAAHCYAGKTGDQIAALFATYSGIVCIISLGAVVRLIAPHLQNKAHDPAVIVVDEAARFVIPALGGHMAGANALAGRLAAALGATLVLTTASDVRATLAVDLLGQELGWGIEADHAALLHCSAAIVNNEPVALVQEAGSKDWWTGHANGRSVALPDNLALFERLEDVDLAQFSAVLWIATRKMPTNIAAALVERCVTYRP